MIHLIVQASKYLMIFLFLVYTFECFHVFKFEGEEEEQKHIYHVQRTLLFLLKRHSGSLSLCARVL